jgi:hypothetical protein
MCAILRRTVVNHVVLYWADCVWVMVCHAEQLVMNDMSQWLISFITSCSTWHTITQTQSAQYQTIWFTTVRFRIPHMIHNHWVSITHHCQGCESWCVMLSMWWWIMLCYTDPCGCGSWCVMLSQWLWIMVCYTDPVVVNHVCYTEANSFGSVSNNMIHNCSVQNSTHDSQPLGQYNTPWFTTTGSALHTMTQDHWSSKMHHNSQPLTHIILMVNHAVLYWSVWLWVMVCNAEPVVVNHGVLYWPSGCESCVLYWTERLTTTDPA